MKEIEINSEHTQEVVGAFARSRVKPQWKLYQCYSCGFLWKERFFVIPFTVSLPVKKYCTKECRTLRHKLRKEKEKVSG